MAASALTEDDIPGSSLAGREPASLKNEELRFWLRCRGDSLKGLKTKALLVKRWGKISCHSKFADSAHVEFASGFDAKIIRNLKLSFFSWKKGWRVYKFWPWSEHCRSRSESDLHEKKRTQRGGEQRCWCECFRWITTEVSIGWLVYQPHQNAFLHSRRNE